MRFPDGNWDPTKTTRFNISIYVLRGLDGICILRRRRDRYDIDHSKTHGMLSFVPDPWKFWYGLWVVLFESRWCILAKGQLPSIGREEYKEFTWNFISLLLKLGGGGVGESWRKSHTKIWKDEDNRRQNCTTEIRAVQEYLLAQLSNQAMNNFHMKFKLGLTSSPSLKVAVRFSEMLEKFRSHLPKWSSPLYE